ncbi:MAG: aminoacyl-tRNA hydrolase [Acidimicrobiaceae bacterium]|nr:aminoacyl-tRNA hydrolase [Acidimicrobiaceae bacterium]
MRRGEPRRGTPSSLLVVGLANPGTEYDGSRHNVGGDAVRELCRRRGLTLKVESRLRAWYITGPSSLGVVSLAVPTTYMNESGAAIPPLLNRSSLSDLSRLVIVHDELDLEPGRLQLKRGGGLAGHNGLRSVAGVLGSSDFVRLRVGIGRPAHKEQVTDWVLRRLSGPHQRELAESAERAADALETVLEHGVDIAQGRVNSGS